MIVKLSNSQIARFESGDDCQIVKKAKLSNLKADMIVTLLSLKVEMIVKLPKQ